jgi:hypothetical protein
MALSAAQLSRHGMSKVCASSESRQHRFSLRRRAVVSVETTLRRAAHFFTDLRRGLKKEGGFTSIRQSRKGC